MVTLLQCVKAHKALTAISEQPMPFKTAHALMIVKKSLLPHVEFFAQEEMKIVDKYAVHDEKGDVKLSHERFTVPNEVYAEYAEKMSELNTTEIERAPVNIDGIDSLSFSINDIEALDGIISFKE